MNTVRLAVAANFTVRPIADALEFWFAELGLPMELDFAPYNQVIQALLDDGGALATNRSGVNVVFVSLGEWAAGGLAPAVLADDFAHAVRASADRSSAAHLVVCCPTDRRPELAEAEARLAAALADDTRVRLVGEAEVQALYPVAVRMDGYTNAAAHVPYTQAMFAALGTVAARAVHAWLTPRPKVIAVDADNTLWDGVVGEDGPLGVRVTPARQAFQRFLLDQRSAGRLICLCSKNSTVDVNDVLTNHPDMLLRPEHITASRVDWQPKPDNLTALAADLNVSTDSFVFLDDNPVECAQMRAARPEVLTLELPADPEAILPFLRHCWPLDQPRVTDDDRARADRYREERARSAARAEAPSLQGFLDGLDLRVDVAPATVDDLVRSAQLTQRTNQFNLTTIRRTEAELAARQCHAVRVRDRFGDYGQVGLIVSEEDGPALVVETFLVSCRVLGRGVEQRVLNAVGRLALDRGLDTIVLRYVPTERNQPALDFLLSLPAEHRDDSFVLSAEPATTVAYRPEATVPAPVDRQAPAPAASTGDHNDLVPRIARTLATAEQVLAAIADRRGARPTAVRTDDPIAATVARIWTELLDFPPTSVDDDFYDLGGHSLLLVRFAGRVRDEFQVELPIDALFTGAFTIADIAATIRDRQLSQVDDDVLAALLADLDGLSDDQVRGLLDADR